MDEPRRRPRLLWLLVALALVAVPVVGVVVLRSAHVGCCGPYVPMGEIWYCHEPDAEHPVGQRFLLETRPAGWRPGQPLRLETGHIGTPLHWRQPAGQVALLIDLDVAPHTNDVVADESTSAVVRENDLTAVLDPGLERGASACPAAPTSMATPYA